MRTVDVARAVDYSVQQVRNLERVGVLPPATRTDAGYRTYSQIHVHAARAYHELVAALGPVAARQLMRSVHAEPAADVLARLDATHASLHFERQLWESAVVAAKSIAAEPIDDPRPADSMGISGLAAGIGVRASTLRHWEAESLVSPQRTSTGRSPTYSPNDVRDVRIVH